MFSLLIALTFASLISWLVRYRYLNMYARLPPEPQRKEPQIDIFPDTQDRGSKPGLANYLDEFLSAIKVFGYLERSVFHELTRTMQTRKLITGETLMLEEEKGFCLVVDGLVQIFVKASRQGSRQDQSMGTREDHAAILGEDEFQEGAQQGYQLLTEVRNGAPMSSLFSILSLFTEDVTLRFNEHGAPDQASSFSGPRMHMKTRSAANPGTPVEPPGSFVSTPTSPQKNDVEGFPSGVLSDVPKLSLDPDMSNGQSLHSHHVISQSGVPRGKHISVHPDIVARAMVDTTIAIIPAAAFRRLTRVYPRATAHIVQVILTRLQRVTLATAHSYLGLTSEVLQTERMMNQYTAYDLPNHLRGTALDHLKDKFKDERDRLQSSQEEITKGIALHNLGAGRRRRSSSHLRNGPMSHANVQHNAKPSVKNGHVPEDQASRVNPGDLLTNIQMSRFGSKHDTVSPSPSRLTNIYAYSEEENLTGLLGQVERSPFRQPAHRTTLQPRRQDSFDADALFRESILDCMFKALGLSNLKTPFHRSRESLEHSPRIISFDADNQSATFTNAFGFMDPFDGSADGDSDSVRSSNAFSGGAQTVKELTNLYRDDLEIVYFPRDSLLVEQGERNPGLYYVIDGFLDVSVQSARSEVNGCHDSGSTTDRFNEPLSPSLARVGTGQTRSSGGRRPQNAAKKSQSRRSLFLTKPGGLAGYVGTISSHRSFVDVRAKTEVYVGFLPREALEHMVEKYPIILLTMAKRLTSLLPKLIQHIDFALEWIQVDAGQVIHNKGDDSDAIYIVLNGRLRAIDEQIDGSVGVRGEFGQGESVGELEVMTETLRPATLHAIRDSELAKFPKMLFNSLALENPGITIKISKLIAQRMRALIDGEVSGPATDRTAGRSGKPPKSRLNLRTIAILPVTTGIPVVDFGSRLLAALTQIGVTNGVASLNQAAILNHLTRHAFSKMGKLKLTQYLADLEERYGMLLYIADTNVNSPWTQTCIVQADCILLVGLADGDPGIGEYERFLLGTKTTARKELVLLHIERYSPPGVTRRWLRNRPWINGGHHHIQMDVRAASEPISPQIKRFGTTLKHRVQVLQAEIQKYTSRRVQQTPVYSEDTLFKSDFHRLARRLCGKSIGLVLGGGGARGISQIGVIRALEEAGIPIDIIGGTSIGAFNGALYAREADVVPMYGRAKRFAGRMGSMWRFALDLTYPSASYTTGHEFNRGIFKTFGDSQIEDFWLEFYCNTTNISKSRQEYHSSGYVWRYVRASMSLAGLLPPLCDEGQMLLDGGYIDNLTVAHMKSLGANVIFAIDVGSLDDHVPQAFGDSLSGAWAFWNRWNPFSPHPNPPTLSEIQARLAYVSSVDALERAKTTPGCLYMRPPIDPYGTLDFAKFDEIYRVGYEYARDYLTKVHDEGLLPLAVKQTEEKRKLQRTMAPRRASV